MSRNFVVKNDYNKGGVHKSVRDYDRKDKSWLDEACFEYEDTLKYYVWPDGTFIHEDEYSAYMDAFRGDDFQLVEIPSSLDGEEVMWDYLKHNKYI